MSATHTSKPTAILLLAVISIALGLPAIVGLFQDPELRSIAENRTLSAAPPVAMMLESPTQFFSQVDDYLNDHFGAALILNRWHNEVSIKIFGDSPSSKVTIGKDGYIFFNSHGSGEKNSIFKMLCSDMEPNTDKASQLEEWEYISDYFSNSGYRFIVGITPTKSVIYADKLPSNVPASYRDACHNFRENNLIFQLREIADKRGWLMVYPFEEFYLERYNGNFYPKESFHNTGFSSHLFASKLLDKAGIDMPAEYSNVLIETESTSDLSHFLGFPLTYQIHDFDYSHFQITTEYNKPNTVKKYYAMADDYRETRTERPVTNKSALVLSNSFGAQVIKHLAPAYKKLTHVNLNNLTSAEGLDFYTKFVEYIAPNDIIFVIHDGAVLFSGKLIRGMLLKIQEGLTIQDINTILAIPDTKEFLETAFIELLHNPIDQVALDYYTDSLNQGTRSRIQLINELIASLTPNE